MCRPKKKGDSKSAPITFADVAGVDTAREELLEVVACLRDARRYSRLNAKTPSGVLLCGPPGTGKTLLGEHTSHPAVQSCLWEGEEKKTRQVKRKGNPRKGNPTS